MYCHFFKIMKGPETSFQLELHEYLSKFYFDASYGSKETIESVLLRMCSNTYNDVTDFEV